MKKIIFVHGYGATPKADWYPNIKPELDKLGVEYSIPDLPGGRFPKYQEWLKTIDNEVSKSGGMEIILVGHSLGTRAILLYLDKFEKKVDSVLLIAAFNNNFNVIRNLFFSNFFKYPVNIQKIKRLAKRFVVMHSKDDSSIAYSEGAEIAKELGAKLITYEDRDHFSDPENYSFVLEELKDLLKQ